MFLLIGTLFSSARGNVISPRAWISEVFVDSTGEWSIEIGFFEWDILEIDSLMLETSSGSSIITYYSFIPGGGFVGFDSLAVITNNNLETALTINNESDFVKLSSHTYNGWEAYDYVAFGDYPGSFLDCINEGESVIGVGYQAFSIDSSPTIGEGENEDGYLGYFSGIVYDLSGNPVTEGFISFIGNAGLQIYPDTTGFFYEDIFARRYTYDTIRQYVPPSPYTKYYYTIEPVDFCLRPDSSYYQDIITTSLVIGVDDKENYGENTVTIAPNPFSDKIVFFFNLKNNDYADIGFSIYSLDGRRIHHIFLSPDQKRYEWYPQNSISSGTYIYRLEKDNSVIKSGKFICL